MLTEPVIVTWGRMFVSVYGIDEYEATLKKAFTGGKQNGFITLESNVYSDVRSQIFLFACAAYSLDHGLIEHNRSVGCGQIEIC